MSAAGKDAAVPMKKSQPVRAKAPAKADPDDISTKKRAYGKSKPKKKSAVAVLGENLKKKRTAKKNKKSAVRLAKKYDGDDTGAFVNGILGSFSRAIAEKTTEEV